MDSWFLIQSAVIHDIPHDCNQGAGVGHELEKLPNLIGYIAHGKIHELYGRVPLSTQCG